MRVELADTGDLKRLAKALRSHADGKELRKELTAGMRAVLRPLVPQVKAAYRSAPSGRGKARRRGGSLRSSLAKATRLEVRTSGRMAGARLRVDGRRMPPGQGSLPAMHEGEKRWRHPLFGNRDVWVAQESHPTFYRTVQPNEAAARAEIERVVGRIFDKIERSV